MKIVALAVLAIALFLALALPSDPCPMGFTDVDLSCYNNEVVK